MYLSESVTNIFFLNTKVPDSVRRLPTTKSPLIAGLDDTWKNLPGTVWTYKCKNNRVGDPSNGNWAFDYSYELTETKPSYAFTKNIKELVIKCNDDG